MARKSKTQKAKASAARQAKKAEKKLQEEKGIQDVSNAAASVQEEAPKKSILQRVKGDDTSKESTSTPSAKKKQGGAIAKSEKKSRFQFFKDVRSELKRVTWPTRIDVLRWSGVVVCALIFFGIFTAVLDNLIVTPLLYLISGVDPTAVDTSSIVDASSAATVDGSADASGVDVSTEDGGDFTVTADDAAVDVDTANDNADGATAEGTDAEEAE